MDDNMKVYINPTGSQVGVPGYSGLTGRNHVDIMADMPVMAAELRQRPHKEIGLFYLPNISKILLRGTCKKTRQLDM